MHDFFIDKISAITLEPNRAKILLKNIMFRISEEALIIAGEFADLMHQYMSQLDIGQRKLVPHWSIESADCFQDLETLTDGKSSNLFGERVGNRLDLGDVYKPPYVAASRSTSNAKLQGIPSNVNDALVRGIEYSIHDWNSTINKFILEFDPYRPPTAIRQMMDTANALRRAANVVIKLTEFHYRIALGLMPIEGISEAEMAYNATVEESGADLKEEVRTKLGQLAGATENRFTAYQQGRIIDELVNTDNWF